MKYIIWGAGQRGRKALEILGKEKIISYVDRNKDLVGQEISDVPIYDISYIKKSREKFIILITPLEYGDQIACELEEKGIKNYFLFAEHPVGIDMSDEVDSMGGIHKAPLINGVVVIYGITWFTLYLYDYFSSMGTRAILYAAGRNKDVLSLLVGDEYDIISSWQCVNEVDYVLAPGGISNIPSEKYIDIDEYVEKTYPVYNFQIEQYRNIHKGERCFVIATGPSLKVSDLDQIMEKREICISMNRIYNLFDKTEWRPNYYVIEDQKMIEDLAEEIAELNLEHKFVCEDAKKYWDLEKSKTSIKYKMVMQDCLNDRIGFSRNLERFVYNGYTVTYVCLQLAVYMGFTDIYLVGVDFSYASDIYSKSNHFEGYQNYYRDIRLNPVMPDRMIRAYKKAKKVTDSMGIHIYNATRGGKLEVFERIDLDKVLEDR